MTKKTAAKIIIYFLLLSACMYAVYAAFSKAAIRSDGLTVLMYHSITNDFNGKYPEYCISPENFEQQIDYLFENGYKSLFADEIFKAVQGEKTVIITFDDGYEDNYTELLPILEKYGFKATVFVTTDLIGRAGFLSEEQIKTLASSGLVSIQSHTESHHDLNNISKNELEKELRSSKNILEDITGKKVNVLAYPYGYGNGFVASAVSRYYDFAYATSRKLGAGKFEIPRKNVSGTLGIDEFSQLLKIS